jgi:hypothetical protein
MMMVSKIISTIMIIINKMEDSLKIIIKLYWIIIPINIIISYPFLSNHTIAKIDKDNVPINLNLIKTIDIR